MLDLESLKSIRPWNGSQDNAFEELCYQLRDATPAEAALWKLGNPDRGYEWYVRLKDRTEWGWQVKYIFTIDNFLKAADESLKTVTKERPNCKKLTFCIPFDLPDVEPKNKGLVTGKSARQKFEDWRDNRNTRIPGAGRIEIYLWSGGDILQRLNTPENRGRAWFFWDSDVLSLSWCKGRVDTARAAAGPRYSDDLNIETPIWSSIEALARADSFRERLESLLTEFNIGSNSLLDPSSSRRINPDTSSAVSHFRFMLTEYVRRAGTAIPDGLNDALTKCVDAVNAEVFSPGSDPPAVSGRKLAKQLLRRINEIEDFLDSPTALIARERNLLVVGEAGQGKTHLLVDTAYRLIAAGQPSALILGGQLSGRQPLKEVAESLGVGVRGWSAMLQAMAAAGEAYGCPFVLFIDAINEADDPRQWRSELATIRAELRHHSPWIVLCVSIRSTYIDFALSETAATFQRVDHQGFAGMEEVAADKFFEYYNLPAPHLPLISDEMANPLFLKLYCQSLASGQVPPTEYGTIHISSLFDHYLSSVNRAVCNNLSLDEGDHLVQECVKDLARKLARSERESLRRDKAKNRIDRRAPHLHAWPRTLFAQLLSEGLLTLDIVYRRKKGKVDPVEVVRFTYQRFADYMIADELLPTVSGIAQLADSLSDGYPLHKRILGSSAGVIEALSVILPERYESELLTVTAWNLDPATLEQWQLAFLHSLPARRAEAITTYSVHLLEQTRSASHRCGEAAAQVLVNLAVRDIALLDGTYLHQHLIGLSMARRDSTWGIALYDGMGKGPLGRIIRWASNENHRSYDDESVLRASIPLVWMLGTPHRPMRDHITKSLARLFAYRLAVLIDLFLMFAEVNDAYIFDRLCSIAYGAAVAGGLADPDGVERVVRVMATVDAERRNTPYILTRDTIRSTIEWCVRNQVLEQDEAGLLPSQPRTSLCLDVPPMKELFNRYGVRGAPKERTGFESVLHSVGGQGDFGVKIIDSDVRFFSFHPLDTPYPSEEPEEPLEDVLQRLRTLGTADTVEDPASMKEHETDIAPPHNAAVESSHFPTTLARSWIFERVLALGWTPELFERFDSSVPSHGRDAHKPERFGKKYQWIALYELLARLADNYHPHPRWGEPETLYRGPWQLLQRDLDPTLPPAQLLSIASSKTKFGPTFERDDSSAWWPTIGPSYRLTDPPVDETWTVCLNDVQSMQSLVRYTDFEGVEWVALHATHGWPEQDPRSGEYSERPRRDQWSHIYSWLVRKNHTADVFKHLSEKSLMGRWMPEGLSPTSSVYLGEMPWALAATEYPQKWESPSGAQPRFPHPVYPTWNEYTWESVILDCSIDETVTAWMPALELFENGRLRWKSGTRTWLDAQSQVAARYVDTTDQNHAALLVRQDWLTEVLAVNNWSVIFGRLGEKQLHNAYSHDPGLIGPWTEIDGTAVLYGSGLWKFGDMRTKQREQETD